MELKLAIGDSQPPPNVSLLDDRTSGITKFNHMNYVLYKVAMRPPRHRAIYCFA
ncbi:MAG: hypothetical protein NZ772_11975 [Cyanobacteria bacterium]|nr:hypothetical protein [Cyanobacteriota bacterium]MDW8201569.1 hypothetical protein [Cyanobacteriota bacterium SKYGB_h_bin112]